MPLTDITLETFQEKGTLEYNKEKDVATVRMDGIIQYVYVYNSDGIPKSEYQIKEEAYMQWKHEDEWDF